MFRIMYAVHIMQMKENENPTVILIFPEEVRWIGDLQGNKTMDYKDVLFL